MKKIILLFAIILSSVVVNAQNPSSKEVKAIQAFLNQPSILGVTNAQAIGVDESNPETWYGVTWSRGHVVSIDWSDKKLTGVLDLSSFTALRKLDVSKNALTGLSVQGCTSLMELKKYNPYLKKVTVHKEIK